MKLCKKCLVTKPYSEFNKHPLLKDGYFNSCKLCNYIAERKRLATPEGKAIRDAYLKTRAEKDKERKKTYKNPRPERNRAKWAVKDALKKGKLVKQPCFVCGIENVEAHHPSYSEDMFLAVVWLCKKHHTEIHSKYPNLLSNL